jgi:UDP-N-acetyl-D-galactosamine dehydrogenase
MEYGIECLNESPKIGFYQAIILAVSHRQFLDLGSKGIRKWGDENSVLFDVKSSLPLGSADARL